MQRVVASACASVLLACAAIAAEAAQSQASVRGCPSKPLRLVVPFAPGGGTDVTARHAGGKLSEKLGQPVVVDDRPAASGIDTAAPLASEIQIGLSNMFSTQSHCKSGRLRLLAHSGAKRTQTMRDLPTIASAPDARPWFLAQGHDVVANTPRSSRA